jgi:hypothetical protein
MQSEILGKVDRLIEALNGLGQNMQWMIDNVQGIFQMFGNPQFMSMLGPMVAGGLGGNSDAGNSAGPEDGADSPLVTTG